MSHAHTLDRRQLLGLMSAAATGILLPAWSSNAAAQPPGWLPTQTINYGIGVAAGGSVDLYARGVKNALEALKLVNGQTVLNENRPGAAGLLAL